MKSTASSLVLFAWILVASAGCSVVGWIPVVVSPDDYLAHISLLAHDELGGRGMGSHGIDLAAGYIAGHFAAVGIEPGGPDGTYFQEFTLRVSAKLLDDTHLEFEGADITAALHDDFTPFSFSSKGDIDGDLVFVGYGITNPDQEHDDYADIDVEGKVVLMLRREPADWDSWYTRHSRFRSKVSLAADHGVAAVLIANRDPGADGNDPLEGFDEGAGDYGLPAMHIRREIADALLAAGGLGSLTDLQTQLNEEGANVSAAVDGVHVHGTVALETTEIIARNVIGVLPGNGPNADEYVVIGAHHDHLGVTRGQINNGADDNASGVAGMIEIARAMAHTKKRDRSIIFIGFTAEEKGMVGSKHYVDHPTVPLESIIAMINLDMIGRFDESSDQNHLGIHGLATGDSFKSIVNRNGKAVGFAGYQGDDSALGPSDHASFYRAGIPALFFFTGVHEDYHRPSDDTPKINAKAAARVADFAYHVALDIANGGDAPEYVEVTQRARIPGRGPRGNRVRIGFMPDFQDESEVPGVLVGRVSPGSGAAKAGMQDGDRIIKIADKKIDSMMDFRPTLKDNKPGDVVEVTVLRDGTEVVLTVELSGG